MFSGTLTSLEMLKAERVAFAKSPYRRTWLLLAFILAGSRTVFGWPIGDNNPVLGHPDQVRVRYLYAGNEHTHLHLQISPEGRVSGTEDKNQYSLLEIKAVKPRILVIRGIHSTLYLCMNSRHQLYGSEKYNENDCNFREVALHDGYNLYFSEKHSAHLKLTPSRGRQMDRFLPLEASGEPTYIGDDSSERFQKSNRDYGSEDPLGMTDNSDVHSPSSDS